MKRGISSTTGGYYSSDEWDRNAYVNVSGGWNTIGDFFGVIQDYSFQFKKYWMCCTLQK